MGFSAVQSGGWDAHHEPPYHGQLHHHRQQTSGPPEATHPVIKLPQLPYAVPVEQAYGEREGIVDRDEELTNAIQVRGPRSVGQMSLRSTLDLGSPSTAFSSMEWFVVSSALVSVEVDRAAGHGRRPDH